MADSFNPIQSLNAMAPDEHNMLLSIGYTQAIRYTQVIWYGPAGLCYNKNQANLSHNVQDAYIVIGYTETRWDNALPVPAAIQYWNALALDERSALLSIGYSEAIW